MIYVLTSVMDKVSGEYMEPQISINDQSAIRDFAFAIKRAKESGGMISYRPQDFVLYKIGQYNSSLAEIIPCKPTQLAEGGSFNEKA